LVKKTFNISLRTNKIHVWKFGTGAKTVVLFHGFGETGADYESVVEELGEEFTIFIPDLPFHGKTNWKEDRFSIIDLVHIYFHLLTQNMSKKGYVIGASMGGRLAISLSQMIPQKIEKLLLLAPEGIKKNRWFGLSTQSIVGRSIFKLFMSNPQLTMALATGLYKVRIINRGTCLFVKRLMKKEKVPALIFKLWVCFRGLKIKYRRPMFRTNLFEVHIAFGSEDRLIPPPKAVECRKLGRAKTYFFTVFHSDLLRKTAKKFILQHLKKSR